MSSVKLNTRQVLYKQKFLIRNLHYIDVKNYKIKIETFIRILYNRLYLENIITIYLCYKKINF